jgi:hypothetical protein
MRKRLWDWLRRGPPGEQPIQLKRGGVYVIECAEPLDKESLSDIETYLTGVKARTGCEFLILDAGFRIATK